MAAGCHEANRFSFIRAINGLSQLIGWRILTLQYKCVSRPTLRAALLHSTIKGRFNK